MGKPGAKRVYCNSCKSDTNHLSDGSHRRTFYDDQSGYWEEIVSTLLTCAGCERATLEEAYTGDGMREQVGPEEYEQHYDLSYFPPRRTDGREPKVFRDLPKALRIIYGESLNAFNSKLYLLCAAGLRALLEGICADKKIKGKKRDNLEEKIDGLASAGLLPKNITDSLHGFRFMGNEAVHSLAIPKREDLHLAIEVAEDILNFLYELDYKASRLPKRKAPTPPPTTPPTPAAPPTPPTPPGTP
jgi:hypothetical protein